MRERKLAGPREMQVATVDFMARSEAAIALWRGTVKARRPGFWTGHWMQAGPGAGIILGNKFPLIEGSS